jgi:SAM-dependent methyltransferase
MLKNIYANIRRCLHHGILDIRYGCKLLRGCKESRFKYLGAYCTASSNYFVLAKLFGKISINETDVIVDVGCGKGRVFNYLLSLKLKNKFIGIEIDQQITEETKQRLKKYPNITIIHGDILENIPDNATIFYMFNPFNDVIMRKFKEQIEKKFKYREVTIIYYNSKHLDIFFNDPKWDLEMFNPYDLDDYQKYSAAILYYRPYL